MIDRVVIVGAGGVGACVAMLLHQAGTAVHLVARGDNLQALRETGLTLRTPTATHVARLPSSDRPVWQKGDVALLCVKSQDTREALEIIPAQVPVVCAQNGVENEALVAESHRAIGMMVWLMAVHLAPGTAELFATGRAGILDLGAVSGDEGVADELSALLRQAGFDSVYRPDIMDWKRAKLISNLPGVLQLLPEPFAESVAEALIAEGREVVGGAGLAYTDLPTFLARMASTQPATIDGLQRPGGSLWQSQKRGSGSELAYLNGYIERLGRAHGLATPINSGLLAQVEAARRASS